jgi:hypothetical protein
VLNFALDPVTVDAPKDATWLLGGETVEAAGVSVVDVPPASLSVQRD